MNKEIHLFIIWSKAKNKYEEIIKDIKTKFDIIGIHDVIWNKDIFSKNLTRFYGENLPANSNKEKHCGSGPFTLIVVCDDNPIYKFRKTSKGLKLVNVNVFDSKEMYRNWTGGGHKIHATNDCNESSHDLIMLTGYSIDDYVKKAKSHDIQKNITQMPGENGWESINKILYILNST
ncbi:MAG: hypothetical protein Q4Q06_08125, partial [Bacteroidota bacterium]|nr:hypothetical protein [Bacteroidota bacterium]